ncbi:sialidase family protein [Muriicola sp. Z0-33]|uniref:sialidase family protein n=1 Tax=Muriicola sp. Z0-33 TaxID=2816957 RepID=UPI002237CDEE|nr:sialidase family protein [Muriicola sp. Z0-33]MCW5515700.1 exo-alpha-sialidase [Muriicola sp. Z0-33]
MKHLTYLSLLSLFLISCQNTPQKSENLISDFGDQPSIAKNTDGEIALVFGNESFIYYSTSKNQGASFSEPSLVASLDGLVLGYSSGPGIAITSSSTVVTAPDESGNLYAWSRPVNSHDKWYGPVQINDIDASVGEFLSDITSTPDGQLYCVWIDTRFLESDNADRHSDAANKSHTIESTPQIEENLSEMTPIGITKGELYNKIGDVPKNAHLAFHDDNEGNLYWVFFDKNKNVLKAENYGEYAKFRERNGDRVKTKGKIYLSSSLDGGKTWSKSKLIYRSPDGSVCECCKPSIISDSDGNLTVMFRNNINGARDLHFTRSTDKGDSFSVPEKLGSGTWKINGCPMDGGGLTIDNNGELNTIWKRKGEIFLSSSSSSEEKIGPGRFPAISANDEHTYIVFSNADAITTIDSDNNTKTKIGTGSFPKVMALKKGAIYFWVNNKGINYRKIL